MAPTSVCSIKLNRLPEAVVAFPPPQRATDIRSQAVARCTGGSTYKGSEKPGGSSSANLANWVIRRRAYRVIALLNSLGKVVERTIIADSLDPDGSD